MWQTLSSIWFSHFVYLSYNRPESASLLPVFWFASPFPVLHVFSYFQICELSFQKLIYIQYYCTFVTLTDSSSQPDQQFPWHYLTPLTLTPLMMWTKRTMVEYQVECNCLFKFIDKTRVTDISILISLPFVFCVITTIPGRRTLFYNSAPILSWRSSIHTHTAIVSHFLGLLSWGLLKPSSLNHEKTEENSILLKMCLLKLKNELIYYCIWMLICVKFATSSNIFTIHSLQMYSGFILVFFSITLMPQKWKRLGCVWFLFDLQPLGVFVSPLCLYWAIPYLVTSCFVLLLLLSVS